MPENNSLSSGQVLPRPYSFDEAAIIVREMSDLLALRLVRKGLLTDQLTLTIGYENLKDSAKLKEYRGELHFDWYGRPVPKHSHGTANLKCMTASSQMIINALLDLYLDITDRELMIRRVTICAARISRCMDICANDEYEQLDLFTDYEAKEQQRQAEKERLQKERSLQLAELEIKEKYGRNAILKGTNFLQGAMTRERNMQIGGHKA